MAIYLPYEVIRLIIFESDNAKDILSFALTCRRISNVALSALYDFNIKQQDSSALHWAAQHDRVQTVVLMLLNHQPKLNALYAGHTPLTRAVCWESGLVATVLLNRRDVDVNITTISGKSALWCACCSGNKNLVLNLLDRGDILVDVPDLNHKLTPFAVAINEGHIETASILLATGRVNINTHDKRGRTPLVHAIVRQSDALVGLLLGEDNINATVRDNRGRFPLAYAAAENLPGVVERLLQRPEVYIHTRTPENRTALWYAVVCGAGRAAKVLLEKGAEIDISDVDGQTLIGQAVMTRSVKMVRTLLDHGADVSFVNGEGKMPLHIAAEKGLQTMIKCLLNHEKIKINGRDNSGNTALHHAVKQGTLSCVKLLLAEPEIDINGRDDCGCTPLWLATHYNYELITKRLLAECDLNVNALCISTTALHNTIKKGSIPITRCLLEHLDLNPNLPDSLGQTALGYAAKKGNIDMVDLLISRKGVCLNGVGDEGPSPLYLASKAGHAAVVRRLLARKETNINLGWGKESPLLVSAVNGHTEVIRALLEDGSRLDINSRDSKGRPALIVAAKAGFSDIVGLLLQDTRTIVDYRDHFGGTALRWAMVKRHELVTQLIINACIEGR